MSTYPVDYEPDFFTAPVLRLESSEEVLHAAAMAAVLDNETVGHAFGALDAESDRTIREHSVRVARTASAAAIKLAMDPREVQLVATGGLLHDIGKSVPHIRTVVHSGQGFGSYPNLRDIIQEHPRAGVSVAQQHGIGENTQRLIGLHHSLQTLRTPYGVAVPCEGVPGDDGFVPDLPTCLGLIAAADIYDALVQDAPNRLYQTGTRIGPDMARFMVSSLRTSEAVKATLIDLVAPHQTMLLPRATYGL